MRINRMSMFSRVAIIGLLGAALPGCTDFSTTPDSLGRVTVSVKDQNNAGVFGQTVNLLKTGPTELWRSFLTSQDGTGEFGKADGDQGAAGAVPGAAAVAAGSRGRRVRQATRNTGPPSVSSGSVKRTRSLGASTRSASSSTPKAVC